MDMQAIIEGRLKPLGLQLCEFRDDSRLHAGHAGNRGGGHYAVVVAGEVFSGMGRLSRQRMVKDSLQDLFSDGLIHALSIKAVTPEEYFH
ncbi:BolA family transcriptional regulator [Neisseria sp.]|uniref:BolA family protein n=1 Tax=Neisseria sp. TaxID=192066 RepID=UPI0026DBED78|nr:BolA family protein [Neisseria sp.]MDO4906490.1 BolA family protein [Neisseria sp.]